MKTLKACSFALVLLFALTALAQGRDSGVAKTTAVRRVALVIGNATYATGPLPNPVNDAQDMAKALRELGFDVSYEKNLKQSDMKAAIRAFGEKLRNSDFGLFYYAGHGVQVKQVNYLVPVDAKVESAADVEYEFVAAGLVLAHMESARNKVNVMILDSCRNNPFPRSLRSIERGLARMEAPTGMLIAYATKPGGVASDGTGRNGIYTQELLKFIRMPSLKVQDVFYKVRESVLELTKNQPEPQVPWEETSLVGDFYFAEPRPIPAAMTTVSPAELLRIIEAQQQSEVRESYGEFRGQNFNDEDLKEFKERNVPRSLADKLKRDGYFIDVVLAIKGMEPAARHKLLGDGLRTYKKTWAQLGKISREGQTEAGQEAERLIAKAIVDLVMELYTLPAEKLNELRGR